nr:CsbD family protein [uncultured Rhodopila sp.]
MNKDRIVGAAREAKGDLEEGVGKGLGDAKLTAEGKADKTEGKVQNAFAGLKDTLKR